VVEGGDDHVPRDASLDVPTPEIEMEPPKGARLPYRIFEPGASGNGCLVVALLVGVLAMFFVVLEMLQFLSRGESDTDTPGGFLIFAVPLMIVAAILAAPALGRWLARRQD
jgi:hypothetical protein